MWGFFLFAQALLIQIMYLPELSGKPRRSGRGWIARMDSSDGEAVHLF
jgi:hypothetical protein